jgi:hypothetical protein
MFINEGTVRRLAPFLLCLPLLMCVGAIKAYAQCSGDNLSTADGYRVRSVKVNTLFGRAPQKLLGMLVKHRGEFYRTTEQDADAISVNPGQPTGTSRDIYRNEVKKFFETDEAVTQDRRFGASQTNSLYIKTTYLTDCVKIVPENECKDSLKDESGNPVSKCVDVEVKIKVLPINTSSLSANLLDLARSNKLAFYKELPRPLVVFNPTFFIEQDRAYGTMATGSLSMNLLELPALLRGDDSLASQTQLHLAVNWRKSFDEPFYQADGKFSLSRIRALKRVENLKAHASFALERTPQGDSERFTNALRIGATALLKFKSNHFNQLSTGANYRYANQRFISKIPALSERTSENGFESRAVVDGHIAGGFLRGALWFDAASPEKRIDGYRRLATTIGYARDLALPQWKCKVVSEGDEETCVYPQKNPPAIGIEMLFSAGKAWGEVPEYAKFYGGNAAGNFLYNAVDESSLTTLPEGPLIRSFGRNKAGIPVNSTTIRGGNSFWNLNLSMSLPIPRLSRPLIPAELVVANNSSDTLTCKDCVSLKDLIKNQVGNGKNIFIDAMAIQRLTAAERDDLTLDRDDGLTPEEETRLQNAERAFDEARVAVLPEADKLWSQLTPAIHYIADRANLFAVKPVLMFDAARLSLNDGPRQKTRIALGGGLQFNVVVAKFEVGYLRTIRRIEGDERGNFIVRLLFEKIF